MNTLTPAPHQGARILLVDDQPDNIGLLRDILSPEGYRLSFAINGQQALDIAARFQPDLILLDVMMPGIDGFETCLRLKKNKATREIPVLFVTARAEADDLARGFEVGGADYLTKPYNTQEIKVRIAHHIGTQAHRCYQQGIIHTLQETLGLAQVEADVALQARKSLLDNLSHEFNTPLNAIIGFSEALLLQENDEKRRNHLNRIVQGGWELHRLCNNLLDISLIESGQTCIATQTFDLNVLLEKVLSQISYLVQQHGIDLQPAITNPLGTLHSDPQKLEHMLFSLLANACKFSPQGKVIFSVHEEPQRSQIKFTIQDTGVGISEEAMETIFQPFSQQDTSLTRIFGGTGLGLSITNFFCKRLGGQLKVTSKLGEGSTFSLTLPRVYRENV